MSTVELGEMPTTPEADDMLAHDYAAALRRGLRSPHDSFGELERHLSAGSPRPLPSNRAVLRSIRSLMLFTAFCAAVCALLLGVLVSNTRDGATVTDPVSPITGPVLLQLSAPGPDPAVDYYAHVVFADGTERDLQLGGFILHTAPVRIELGVESEPGAETSCRIVIDGVRAAQESAIDGRAAVCRWEA